MARIESLYSTDKEKGKPFLTEPRRVVPLFPDEYRWITEYASSNKYSNSQRIVIDWNHRQPPPPVYRDTVPNGRFIVKYDQNKPFNNITTTQEALVRIDISEDLGLIFGGGSSIAVDHDGIWSATGPLMVATVKNGIESLAMFGDTKFTIENGKVESLPMDPLRTKALADVAAALRRPFERVDALLREPGNNAGTLFQALLAQKEARSADPDDAGAPVVAEPVLADIPVFESPAATISGNGTASAPTRRFTPALAQPVQPAVKG